MNKIEIRNNLKRKRKLLDESYKISASKKITRKVLKVIKTKKLKRVALYLSTQNEVNTYLLAKELKSFFVPVIYKYPKHKMHMQQSYYRDKFVLDKFNIKSVKMNHKKMVKITNIDAIIVPMVGFDENRNRLGMGKGFYDRFLYNKRTPLLIGVAFDVQKHVSIPCDLFDKKMHIIITESQQL